MARKAINTDISKTKNVSSVEENNSEEIIIEPLNDDDEVAVYSCVPNLSYLDSKSGDMYTWENVNDVEYITFETLKNMYRSHRNYFRNFYIRIDNEWLIKKFSLTKFYDDYLYLMDSRNYISKNIKSISTKITEAPSGLNFTIINKIKIWVHDGEITDIKIIRELENILKMDFISFI